MTCNSGSSLKSWNGNCRCQHKTRKRSLAHKLFARVYVHLWPAVEAQILGNRHNFRHICGCAEMFLGGPSWLLARSQAAAKRCSIVLHLLIYNAEVAVQELPQAPSLPLVPGCQTRTNYLFQQSQCKQRCWAKRRTASCVTRGAQPLRIPRLHAESGLNAACCDAQFSCLQQLSEFGGCAACNISESKQFLVSARARKSMPWTAAMCTSPQLPPRCATAGRRSVQGRSIVPAACKNHGEKCL